MATYERNLSNRVLVVKGVKILGESDSLQLQKVSSYRALMESKKTTTEAREVAEFAGSHSVRIVGERTVCSSGASLSAIVLRNGVEMSSSEYSRENEFQWRSSLSSSDMDLRGKDIVIPSSEVLEGGTEFVLKWDHVLESGAVASFVVPFTLYLADIVQYTWSNIDDVNELIPIADTLPWYTYSDSLGHTERYMWRRVSSDGGNTWKYFRETGIAGEQGDSGVSIAYLYLYRRASSTPASFDGGPLTYTFATNVLDGNLGSWSRTPPSGSDTLYFIGVYVYSSEGSDTIDIGEWSLPAVMSETGSTGQDGKTVATVILYTRSSGTPTVPSGTVTFSFHSMTVTGAGSWTMHIPAGTDPVWAIMATAISSGTEDAISSSEWSAPAKVMYNGEDARFLSISNNIQTFNIAWDGTPKGTATATLTANKVNISGTVTWSTGETGDSIQVPYDSTATYPIVITATCGDYTATTSIAMVKDAEPPLDVVPSVTSWTFPASDLGVIDPTTFSCTIVSYKGPGNTVAPAYSIYSSSGCTPVLTGNVLTISAMASDEASITIEAVYGTDRIRKTVVLAKARQGLDGKYREFSYALGTSSSEAPSSGWTSAPSSLSDEYPYLWMRQRLCTPESDGTVTYGPWSTPVLCGTDIDGSIEEVYSVIDQTSDQIALKVGTNTSLGGLAVTWTGKSATTTMDGKVIVNGSVTAEKIDTDSLGAKKIHLNNMGAIHAGCYDENGKDTGTGAGVYIGADGVVKAVSMAATDISVNSVDSTSNETILATRTSSGTVVTKNLSIAADRYLVSEVAGADKAWTAGTNSLNGTTYEKVAVNTSSEAEDKLWGTGTKPTALAQGANADMFCYIYSNKSSITETTSVKGLLAGGFRGQVTINWQMQTFGAPHNNNRCSICVSEDGGSTWTEVFHTGWISAKTLDERPDGDNGTVYLVGVRSYSNTISVTPSTIIRFDFYWSTTEMRSSALSNVWSYLYKETYVYIDSVQMSKTVSATSVAFANATTEPYNVGLSNYYGSSLPMTVLGTASSSKMDHVLGQTLISAVRTALGRDYTGKVDNASYKATSTVSFSNLNITSFTLQMGQFSVSGDSIIAVSSHVFTVVFTTKIKAAGIEIGALYCNSFIGMIQFFMRKTAPDGWLECAGGFVAKTDYPLIWNMMNTSFTTDSPRYVSDSDIQGTGIDLDDGIYFSPSYVRVPNLMSYSADGGRFLRGGSASAVGTVQDDKIRSITGVLSGGTVAASQFLGDTLTASGVFTLNNPGTKRGMDEAGSTVYGAESLSFSANAGTSSTNEMAGHADGNDIHPAGLIALPCIYVGE